MRRVIVRRSSVHGKGVVAIQPRADGERVLEYKGQITSSQNAVRRHQREGIEGHTLIFGLSDGRVIDGDRGGNSARWLNHVCAPNCETLDDDSSNEYVRAQYACRSVRRTVVSRR